MKLRDRQKRVSNDIKQEDTKAGITLTNTSSTTVDVSNTWIRDIKQEDTKNDSSLSQQDGRFEEKDYFYRCDICNQRMPNLKSVLQHRVSAHNVNHSTTRIIKDVSTEPDIHDPNYYCKSCEKRYDCKKVYRNHLRAAHFMVLKTLLKRAIPQTIIVPDPDDPNLYCRTCDYTYARKASYKEHCRYRHGMKSVKFDTALSKSDGITDTYCKRCDMRSVNKTAYKKHLFAIHKIDWRLVQQKPKKCSARR
ncbi:hypothetical protein PS6_006961 [Mucor atramentarius]